MGGGGHGVLKIKSQHSFMDAQKDCIMAWIQWKLWIAACFLKCGMSKTTAHMSLPYEFMLAAVHDSSGAARQPPSI